MADRRFRVLTAIGKDRPGLVHGMSSLIHGAGANLEDSRMAVLGGEFAMVLLFSGNDAALAKVDADRDRAAKQLGLEIFVRDTQAPSASAESRHRLRVTGIDRPGIVDVVTNVIARREVNLDSVDTRVTHQPLTGTPVFTLQVELRLPAGVSLEELRTELQRVCDAEQLELEL